MALGHLRDKNKVSERGLMSLHTAGTSLDNKYFVVNHLQYLGVPLHYQYQYRPID